MRQAIGAVAIACMTAVLGAPAVSALPVVDQSFVGPTDLGMNINEGCKYAGQTFTAGMSGNLVAVSIQVHTYASDPPPLRLAIRQAATSGPPLAAQFLQDQEAPISRVVTLKTPVAVSAGTHYAILVSYKGATPGQYPGLGVWAGQTGNLYNGGRLIARSCSYSTPWWARPDYDLHFVTFVDPTLR